MKTSSPLMSETVIATSRDEIIASAGSKYCPVAAGEVLRMAMKREESFAFVGLPCHIHGIRKAGKVLPQWKRNPLLIGLFCGYGKTFRLLDAVLEHFAVRRDDVEMVEFRHGGWPGCMRIQTRQGGVHMMPYASYFRREYTPPRCSLCCDGSAEMADISCADAWLPEFRGRFPGVSLVITRTEQGEAAVQQALADKAIILEPIDVAQVIQSQNRMLLRKKSQIGAHRAYRKLLGRTVPEYGIEYTGTRFRDYATALAMNFRIYAANHRSLSIFGKFVTMVRYLVHKRRLRLRQQQRMFVHQREQSHLSRVGQDLPQDETKGRA